MPKRKVKMTAKVTIDYTGYSKESLDEAIIDALQKAGKPTHFEVIETRSSHLPDNNCQYSVTLTAIGK
jgi:flavin-binding protein dodecin